MSVDVEDYFQVQAFVRFAPRSTWDAWPSRVERNTRRLLDLFDATSTEGTFFVLGWVARKHPGLVREIAARGHEVASHGMNHQMLTEQTPRTFREDARDSKAILEDLSGAPVLGFRAPSYSVNRSTLWAIDVLSETGYRYDSSVYPIRRRRYGYPEGPTVPAILRAESGSLPEFPLPTIGLGPVRFPVLAGAYLRLAPSWISLGAARRYRERREPAVVNVHPWEIDPDQPTVGPGRSRVWTHYARLGRTEAILRGVLETGTFRSVARRLADLGLLAAGRKAGVS
jgi:polysaccharide deacetylase family protein (PEP-CTERM system associated)